MTSYDRQTQVVFLPKKKQLRSIVTNALRSDNQTYGEQIRTVASTIWCKSHTLPPNVPYAVVVFQEASPN